MEKEFDVNKQIGLPEQLLIKQIADRYLVVALNCPNWLVLEANEYHFFTLLREQTLLNSLTQYAEKYSLGEAETLETAQNVLKKLEIYRFYAGIPLAPQEDITAISKLIHINVLNDCNLRCKHCFLSAGISPRQQLDINMLLDFLKKLFKRVNNATNDTKEAVISGGEPLLYPDLRKLLQFLKDNDYAVTLFTNGLLIDDRNIVWLKQLVSSIQVSMEGISRSAYESIRGINTYEALLNTLNLIKQHEIPLVLAITALDEVFDDMETHLPSFVRELDYEHIEVKLNDEVDRKGNAIHLNPANFQLSYDKKNRIRNLLRALAEQGFYAENNTKNRNIHFNNCGIGANIVINYDGNIYPCFFFEKPFFTIHDSPETIIESFNKLNTSTELDKIEKCADCELKYICCGGCRLQNCVKNGSYTSAYCTEATKEQKLLALFAEALE